MLKKYKKKVLIFEEASGLHKFAILIKISL
jgi:hypothetical protein